MRTDVCHWVEQSVTNRVRYVKSYCGRSTQLFCMTDTKRGGFMIPPKDAKPAPQNDAQPADVFKGPTSAEEVALNLFYNSFQKPVELSQANTFLSTQEIYDKLREHCGELSFTVQWLHEWLVKSGYEFQHIGDMNIVWYLLEA